MRAGWMEVWVGGALGTKNLPHLRCQWVFRVWIPALTLRLRSGQARWANLFRASGTGWMRDGSIDFLDYVFEVRKE